MFDQQTLDLAAALIREFEGCRLSVYPDVGGLRTVGWGCRTDLPLDATITQDEADQLLLDALNSTADGVAKVVTVDLTPERAAALICFTYNVGIGNLRASTLLRLLNGGDYDSVPSQLMRWDRVAGEEVAGLKRRRSAEIALWNGTEAA